MIVFSSPNTPRNTQIADDNARYRRADTCAVKTDESGFIEDDTQFNTSLPRSVNQRHAYDVCRCFSSCSVSRSSGRWYWVITKVRTRKLIHIHVPSGVTYTLALRGDNILGDPKT
ncbi:hypothetical protein TNCV_261591 [Trichonephila clavipes]|nr:hypothetical protein TNCV_261591 [Trichonephila clavipes]